MAGPRFTATIDVEPIRSYYGQLAIALRQSLPRTIRMEAAATVRRAMQMQKSARVSTLRKTLTRSVMAEIPSVGQVGGSINISNRATKWGRDQVWMRLGDIQKAVPMGRWNRRVTYAPSDHDGLGWRMSADRWQKFKAAFAAHRPRAKGAVDQAMRARGIAAKSWFELLLKIDGGQAEGIADYIRRARPIKGVSRSVAFAAMAGERGMQPELTVVNTSGITSAAGGSHKLQSAISIRRKFFARSFEQGFLWDARFVARNYPWATVSKV